MDTTTKLTATHKLLLSAMTVTAADDGLEALDNEHILDAYPDGLTAEAEATFELVRHVGMRNPSDRELLMATLLATQAAQIQDLQERVALMELAQA